MFTNKGACSVSASRAFLAALENFFVSKAPRACSSSHARALSKSFTHCVDSGLATSTFQSQRTLLGVLSREAILRDLIGFKEGSQAPFRIGIDTLPKAMLVAPPEHVNIQQYWIELDRIMVELDRQNRLQGTTHNSVTSPSRDLWLPKAPNMDLGRWLDHRLQLLSGCCAAANVALRHQSVCRPFLLASWEQGLKPANGLLRPSGKSSLISGRPLQRYLKSPAGLPPYPGLQLSSFLSQSRAQRLRKPPKEASNLHASRSSRASIRIDLIGAERQISKLLQDFENGQVVAPGRTQRASRQAPGPRTKWPIADAGDRRYAGEVLASACTQYTQCM